MRGDETQSALAKEGPRHAAPRKSLLNRIQGPAGKAMALAAMPTAVFVGMGLTPKLALADEKDIPFAPGPCVTRSDEPTPEATETAKPTESAKPTADHSATATPSATATTGPTATASATASASTTSAPTATATPTPTATETGASTAQQARDVVPTATPSATATPSPTPTATNSTNPLDPLGLGDKLKDLFDGPAPKPTATTAAPTTAAPVQKTVTDDEPTATASATAGTTAPAKPKATADPTTDPTTAPTADPAAEATKKAIEKAADKAGATVKELPESSKGLDPKKDESIPDGAKPRFPCPELDAEALAAAELEPGIPLLPDEPWRLESTLLTLKGLKYHGIVEVKTGSGKIKKVLKFTASGIDIKDLHQLTVHSEGLTGHVRSNKGSTSTITDGTVTMYTEELKGNLFGLIPITFGPESPPPLDVPFAFFTNVKLKQAGQFGGTLKVPGLRNTVEPN